ncbi:hypothetical protein QPK87_03440 [Kamptonema cortianum]|nr:hypothetical protein [Kamptonema cortianum]
MSIYLYVRVAGVDAVIVCCCIFASFSLQNCFALLDEDQENNITHNQTLAPSTPLKGPTKEDIFSPLTNLENKLSPVRNAIAIKKTIRGPLSPESIGRIYEEIAPEFLTTEMYLDPSILDLEKSIERMRVGLNPITYDGQETDVHHPTQTAKEKNPYTKKNCTKVRIDIL